MLAKSACVQCAAGLPRSKPPSQRQHAGIAPSLRAQRRRACTAPKTNTTVRGGCQVLGRGGLAPLSSEPAPPASAAGRGPAGASALSRRNLLLASSLWLGAGAVSCRAAAVEDATPSDGEVVPVERRLPAADERYQGLKVLVAGATGGVGRKVVERLVSEGVPVRALVRDGVKASSVLPSASQGVEIVEGDVYQYQSVANAIKGCNVVICATGPTNRLDPLGPYKVDYEGTSNLVAAAKQAGVKKFVFVTSIGCDDILFPLNLYWGVLLWKKQGEQVLQRSGLDYTIVRPGGLLNEPRAGQKEGGVEMGRADTYGLPPRKTPGSILRKQVADCCVEALVEPAASRKVVEIIAKQELPRRPYTELFASV